jgi:hypothetical protein
MLALAQRFAKPQDGVVSRITMASTWYRRISLTRSHARWEGSSAWRTRVEVGPTADCET